MSSSPNKSNSNSKTSANPEQTGMSKHNRCLHRLASSSSRIQKKNQQQQKQKKKPATAAAAAAAAVAAAAALPPLKRCSSNNYFAVVENVLFSSSAHLDSLKVLLGAKDIMILHSLEQVNALSLTCSLRDMYERIFATPFVPCPSNQFKLKKLVTYTLLSRFYETFSRHPASCLDAYKGSKMVCQEAFLHPDKLGACIRSTLKLMINRVAREIGDLKYNNSNPKPW